MAKVIKKKISRIKTKKKVWCKIIAPRTFNLKEIGEAYLSNAEKALGRVMKINLKELTGNIKDQNVIISLQLNGVDGTKLNTAIIGYQLSTTYIKRAVRKNITRLDDYFELKTKDGELVVLKTLTITRHRVQRSVRTTLRKELGQNLKAQLEKTDFDNFFSEIVNRKVQSSLKRSLSKIYPLKEVAVRILKRKPKPISTTAVKEKFPKEEPAQEGSEKQE